MSDRQKAVYKTMLSGLLAHEGEFSNSVLGPVLRNAAVCDGIAKFVKLALDELGVKCRVVIGVITGLAPYAPRVSPFSVYESTPQAAARRR